MSDLFYISVKESEGFQGCRKIKLKKCVNSFRIWGCYLSPPSGCLQTTLYIIMKENTEKDIIDMRDLLVHSVACVLLIQREAWLILWDEGWLSALRMCLGIPHTVDLCCCCCWAQHCGIRDVPPPPTPTPQSACLSDPILMWSSRRCDSWLGF